MTKWQTRLLPRRDQAGVLVPGATKAQMDFARETHRWVGPFPILEFLDEVLPPSTTYSDPPHDIFHIIPSDKGERPMYPKLISALKSLKLGSLQFIDTSANADPKAPSYKEWKPDISTYSSKFQPENRMDWTYSTTSKGSAPSQTHISDLLLHFELKQGNHDPFCDNPTGPDAQFESAAHIGTQGQIAAVLSDLLSYSFRTHTFAVFMDSCIARLFRADRAGILVSTAFNYRTDPKHLVNFLSRFNDADFEWRGIDTTVGRDHQDIQVPIGSNSSGYITVSLKPKEDLPHTESLVGRGRRVFRVHNPSTDQSYIMKDGWRTNLPGITPEWDIINDLNQAGVPHIPTILCGGPIGGKHHSTLADQHSEKEWRVGPRTKLTPRQHYRLIEDDAGKPLAEFKDAKELTQVLADVIEALGGAWDQRRYLHRDVSSANIMITPDGRGVLIDWEFAKRVPLRGEERPERGRAIDRTGTWAYISSALLRYPMKPHSEFDDMQSVLWVAFENALNRLHHTHTDLSGAADALLQYDPYTKLGGRLKWHLLGEPPFIQFNANPAFSKLLNDFFKMMFRADSWEVQPFLPHDPGDTVEASPKPSNVPDHRMLLARFQESLDRPNHEWSDKKFDGIPLLRLAMERAERDKLPGSTSSHSTASKRPSTSQGNPNSEVELRSSKRLKDSASAPSPA